LKSLSVNLASLLVYCENKDTISKLLYISKENNVITEELANNTEKLFMTPFYFFYRKLFCESLKNNIKNIDFILSSKKKISFFEKTINNLNQELNITELLDNNLPTTKHENLYNLIEKSELIA